MKERARSAAVVALTAAAYAQEHCGPGVTITELMIRQIMMP
jgi:hypothetical protein